MIRQRTWLIASCCAVGALVVVLCILALFPSDSETEQDSNESPPQGPVLLRDVSDQCGISFRHTDGGCGRRYIVESVAGGLALFDYDGDGDIDIYLLNGAPLLGTEASSRPTNALYRNDGDCNFIDVTEPAGVGDEGYALGVTAADYDNDGNVDLYVNNFGPNVLFRNNGDGTFNDVTSKADVSCGNKVGAGACFLDADADGNLDLYVANYVDFTYENHVPCSVDGLPAYAGPKDYDPVPDSLWRNNGDGTFADISGPSGIGAHAGSGMGMVCADYDCDGDTDVFVCNDLRRNFFFKNDGTGTFEEVALVVGAAYNYYGGENASMGVDCGDYNNDGFLDFYMTNYQGELPVLYENNAGGFLDDVTQRARAGLGAYQHVTWGNGLVDFDNDGHRDLYVVCGHIQDNVDLRDDRTSYLARNVLLHNSGKATFDNVSDISGDGMLPKSSSRGAGFDDLDDDGDVDAVVLNSRRKPTVLENETNNGNHWLQIQLVGIKSNRDGVGAQVHVVAGDLRQVAEVHSGRSYQSHYGSRLHFGLGSRPQVDRVEVRWIGGGQDVVTEVAADQILTITEGSNPIGDLGS